MNLFLKNEESIIEKLNNMVQLAKEYDFFFFSWGFYYWNAGPFTYKKILGDCRT